VLKRQTAGSVVCASCGYLVGVNDATCYNCGRRNPGLWGYAPALRSLGQDLGFVQFMTVLCLIMYALTLLATGPGVFGGGMFSFLSPSGPVLAQYGAAGSVPVFLLGRWWTVLSAGWLHGGILHILFNIYWIRMFAPAVAEMYGPGRMVVIYTVGSVAGFVLSSSAGATLGFLPIPFLQGATLTVGASAAIFGLLGALVYYGRRTGSSAVSSQAKSYALFFIMFGFILPGVDNYAHLGGFGGGYLMAQLFDPLRPERINHLLMAVICLAASVLSLLASIFLRVF